MVFRDPFYTGVLQYGETIVNLTELYDYTPMVTVEQFLLINKFSDIKKALIQRDRGYRGEIDADLMRQGVICSYCSEGMTSYLKHKQNARKGLTHYFYYRCDTSDCRFRGKNVRANVVVDYAKDFLAKHTSALTSKMAYEGYVEEMKRVNRNRTEEMETKRRSLIKQRSDAERVIEQTKELLRTETDEAIKDIFRADLKVKLATVEAYTNEIKTISEAQKKGDSAIVSYEKFMELFGSLPVIIGQTKTLKQLNFIMEKIFLNFTVKGKKVLSCQLKPPFKEIVERASVSTGRGGGNRTHYLAVPNRTCYRYTTPR